MSSLFDNPTFAGEIMVARKNAMNIYNTKIDDLADGISKGLPKFTKQERLDHYCKKLCKTWDSHFKKKMRNK
jgi:hypothetical protein